MAPENGLDGGTRKHGINTSWEETAAYLAIVSPSGMLNPRQQSRIAGGENSWGSIRKAGSRGALREPIETPLDAKVKRTNSATTSRRELNQSERAERDEGDEAPGCETTTITTTQKQQKRGDTQQGLLQSSGMSTREMSILGHKRDDSIQRTPRDPHAYRGTGKGSESEAFLARGAGGRSSSWTLPFKNPPPVKTSLTGRGRDPSRTKTRESSNAPSRTLRTRTQVRLTRLDAPCHHTEPLPPRPRSTNRRRLRITPQPAPSNKNPPEHRVSCYHVRPFDTRLFCRFAEYGAGIRRVLRHLGKRRGRRSVVRGYFRGRGGG